MPVRHKDKKKEVCVISRQRGQLFRPGPVKPKTIKKMNEDTKRILEHLENGENPREIATRLKMRPGRVRECMDYYRQRHPNLPSFFPPKALKIWNIKRRKITLRFIKNTGEKLKEEKGISIDWLNAMAVEMKFDIIEKAIFLGLMAGMSVKEIRQGLSFLKAGMLAGLLTVFFRVSRRLQNI